MGSTRLPGKVLADIDGCPMLWRVLERTRLARIVDEVVVATTTKAADEPIVALCQEHAVKCFRGSELDVLDRYYQAAVENGADVVVRITSDCPLIDPEVIDKVVNVFLSEPCDYASNCAVRTYPRGLDTEVVAFRALEAAHFDARQSYQRAHVMPYIYENPGRFKILSVTTEDEDYSAYRWTVDTMEDLEFVRAVYDRLKDPRFLMDDVLKLMECEPELLEINRSIAQKEVYEG
jgi:spore coat polysaccharide biosynthesis protein SpsF